MPGPYIPVPLEVDPHEIYSVRQGRILSWVPWHCFVFREFVS